MKIARRIRDISESMTLALTAKAKAMKAEGKDVVGFGAGEPDFDTPDFIKEVAIEDIRKGFTKYTAASGLPELLQAVCDKLRRDNGLEYTPKQIVISCGGKHSLYNIILTIVDDGDEVIIPAPYWLTYPEQVKAAGGTSVFVDCPSSQGFKMTPAQLEAAITPKTVALVLNSPSNPTGAVYAPEELKALGAVLERHPQVAIISDEIYERLLYDGARHASIAALCPSLKDRTFVCGGWAKAYSMTGWRLGFTAGPLEPMKAIARLQSHATSNVTSFCQHAAIVALQSDHKFLEGWLAEFDRRRKFIVETLSKMPGVKCDPPQGAFYVFPDVSGTYGKNLSGKVISNSMEFAEWLLEKALVSVVPGVCFGDDRCIRLSYATSMANIQKGMERLAAFLK